MTRIWVEGNEDEELINALLLHLGVTTEVNVSKVGGWTNLKLLLPNKLRQTVDEGGKNLVVFDADHPSEGGHAHRKSTILGDAARASVPVEVFLLPDDASDGALEDLMIQMVPPRHQPVMACFDRFEECLGGLDHPDPEKAYVVDLDKTRTYAYPRAHPLDTRQKNRLTDSGATKLFDAPDIWDLDAPAVEPLRDFLRQHLS